MCTRRYSGSITSAHRTHTSQQTPNIMRTETATQVLPVSFFERGNTAFFNSVVVFDADGRRLGLYRKSHIPDGPGYQVKSRYFAHPLLHLHGYALLTCCLSRRFVVALLCADHIQEHQSGLWAVVLRASRVWNSAVTAVPFSVYCLYHWYLTFCETHERRLNRLHVLDLVFVFIAAAKNIRRRSFISALGIRASRFSKRSSAR